MITVYIYTLENPIDGNIFYVGQTICPQVRLNTHIIDAAGRDNRKKSKVIKSILDNQMLPKLEVVDEIACKYYDDEDAAHQLESYWMHQIKAWGFDLCNVNGLKQDLTYKRRLGKYLEETAEEKFRREASSLLYEFDDFFNELLSDSQVPNFMKYALLVEQYRISEILLSKDGSEWGTIIGNPYFYEKEEYRSGLPYIDKIAALSNKVNALSAP